MEANLQWTLLWYRQVLGPKQNDYTINLRNNTRQAIQNLKMSGMLVNELILNQFSKKD